MLAVGNSELGAAVPDMMPCPHCGKMRIVSYANEVQGDGTRKPCKLLAAVKCGDKSYLVGVAGRLIK